MTTPGADGRYRLNERGYGTHQAIADQVRTGSRVLDAGCARGDLMAMLQQTKGCHVAGIEDHEPFVLEAHALGLDVVHGSLLDPAVVDGFGAGSFDSVICADVLEHLAEPERALEALRPLVADGGSLVASIPNVVSARARLRLVAGVWRYDETGIFDRTHLRFYSVRTARELLEHSGYTVTARIPVGPLTHRLGRRGLLLTALRPGLLANQVVFVASPTRT